MNIMEILGKMGFNWRMALANLVNFLIIFWLLKKYAWKPLQKTIQEREDKIDKGLEDAKRAASEVTMAKENYDQKINEAKKEANLIIAKASEQGRSMISKAAEDASEKAEKIVTNAKEIIEKEKEKMKEDLKQETVEIAIEITEKILKEKLDDKKFISKLTD